MWVGRPGGVELWVARRVGPDGGEVAGRVGGGGRVGMDWLVGTFCTARKGLCMSRVNKALRRGRQR